MKIIILVPLHVRTGGPEALHQLSDALLQAGYDAYVWYIDEQDLRFLFDLINNKKQLSDTPLTLALKRSPFEEYQQYSTQPITEIHPEDDTLFVVPEVYAHLIFPFFKNKVLIWWLSVDNGFHACSQINLNFLRQPNLFHAHQCHYIASFLRSLGLKSHPLSDYTPIFQLTNYHPIPVQKRPQLVAINAGKKVISDIDLIISKIKSAIPSVDLIKISGMQRNDVLQSFSRSRLFIDLGNFPGKDRMAREAALLGCNVLISKSGAAAYDEDFPLPGIYKKDFYDYDGIISTACHMLEYSEFHQMMQNDFVTTCRGEKDNFFQEVAELFERIAFGESALQRSPRHRPIKPTICETSSNFEGEDAPFCTVDNHRYAKWLDFHSLRKVDVKPYVVEKVASWRWTPSITFFSLVRSVDLARIAETIQSLCNQSYLNWRCIIISDQLPPDPIFQSTDFLGWLQLESLDDPGVISDAVNSLITEIGGDIFSIIYPGVHFQPHALLTVADYFVSDEATVAVYSDHDHLKDGRRVEAWFKPDFDLELFYCYDYIGPAVWFLTKALGAIGGFRAYSNAEAYDALLRIADNGWRISHIPEQLVSVPYEQKHQIISGRSERAAVLKDHFARQNRNVRLIPSGLVGAWHVHEEGQLPRVSVIVPVGDVFSYAALALKSIVQKTDYPDWELIVVEHAISDPDLIKFITQLSTQFTRLHRIRDDKPYALARLYNAGAAHASGDVFVFLHADVEIVDKTWLEQLIRTAMRPEAGVVGPLVLQPEKEIIESAGLFLGGAETAIATHRLAYRGAPATAPGNLGALQLTHQVGALPSVALATPASIYRMVGGFDEECFGVSGFEIDYALKVRARGKTVLLTPLSRVVHHGKAFVQTLFSDPLKSVQHQGQKDSCSELLLTRYGTQLATDPFSSVHFDYRSPIPKLDLVFPLTWGRHHCHQRKILALMPPESPPSIRVAFRKLVRLGLVQLKMVEWHREPSVTELLKLSPDLCLLWLAEVPRQEQVQWIESCHRAASHIPFLFGIGSTFRSEEIDVNFPVHAHGRRLLRSVLRCSSGAVVTKHNLQSLVRELIPDKTVWLLPEDPSDESLGSWEELFKQNFLAVA